jgi:hypothetical protein
MNYDTYDLNDIYPFKIYTTEKDETLKDVGKKLNVDIETLEYLNDLDQNAKNKKFKIGTVY